MCLWVSTSVDACIESRLDSAASDCGPFVSMGAGPLPQEQLRPPAVAYGPITRAFCAGEVFALLCERLLELPGLVRGSLERGEPPWSEGHLCLAVEACQVDKSDVRGGCCCVRLCLTATSISWPVRALGS